MTPCLYYRQPSHFTKNCRTALHHNRKAQIRDKAHYRLVLCYGGTLTFKSYMLLRLNLTLFLKTNLNLFVPLYYYFNVLCFFLCSVKKSSLIFKYFKNDAIWVYHVFFCYGSGILILTWGYCNVTSVRLWLFIIVWYLHEISNYPIWIKVDCNLTRVLMFLCFELEAYMEWGQEPPCLY